MEDDRPRGANSSGQSDSKNSLYHPRGLSMLGAVSLSDFRQCGIPGWLVAIAMNSI